MIVATANTAARFHRLHVIFHACARRVGRGVMDLVLLFVILVVLGFSVLAVGLLLTMET